jgi:hypothetical protein
MIRKILFLASNPTNTGRLRLDKEFREIAEGLKRANERKRFDLIPNLAVRVEDLRRALLDNSPAIVHFAGHGDGTDGIFTENDQGEAYGVPNEALAGLFELCAGHIECVILNACYSDVQAGAIAKYIPYVIGMTAGISDDASLEFAVGFYDALGAGKSIEEAFQFGRNAIALKGIPEHAVPVLKKKELTEAERQRLETSYSPASDIFMDISVLNEETSSWPRGDDTILRYSIERNEERIKIYDHLGYLESFRGGGPIRPLSYITPSLCAFRWDFPILDFKILNNRQETLFITEVVLDVEESRPDPAPFLTIKRDVQQRNAGVLMIVNEGWCDLTNLRISFSLLPGVVENPPSTEPPYPHSVSLPLLADHDEVDVTQAFQDDGANIEGLSLLCDGKWESQEAFLAPTKDGVEERMTPAELEERVKKYLGPFQESVGTLVGEINFQTTHDPGGSHLVKFWAIVFLENKNRLGLHKPPSYAYDTDFDSENISYQRRVQISHEVQPGETDRFTLKVAVPKSSSHRFRATVRDITGLELVSLPIEMRCFVPRTRAQAVKRSISSPPTE